MALVENSSQLISISADGIMMLSSVSVLVKGIPIGYQPSVHLPTVHLMRQSDLVALDDRIIELKNQVSCMPVMLCAAPVLPGWPPCFVSPSQQSIPGAKTSRQRQKRRQAIQELAAFPVFQALHTFASVNCAWQLRLAIALHPPLQEAAEAGMSKA